MTRAAPGLALLCLLGATAALGATVPRYTYYANNPNTQGQLTLVGYQDGTSYTVTRLPTNAVLSTGTINKFGRQTIAVGAGKFKLTTDRPVLAQLGYDCCNLSGSYFYPQLDGKKYYGTHFIISPMATAGAETVVYARQAASVTIKDAVGNTVATSPALAANKSWVPSGLSAGGIYEVTATGEVAIASNAQNGFTAVPPVPVSDPLQDCNSDVGTEFMFSTRNWRTGALAVFNSGTVSATFSVTRLANGAAAAAHHLGSGSAPGGEGDVSGGTNVTLTNIVVPAGGAYFATQLGNDHYRLVFSAGSGEVWAGDTEGPGTVDDVDDLGDDVTLNFGEGGLRFLVRSQTNGGAFASTLFVRDDNTSITYTDGVTPVTVTKNRDEFIDLAAGTTWTITATKPVSVQTIGGNGLNDWAMALRPAARFDDDNNGIADSAEGGSCESQAPDSDGDGLYDFEDPDDDNDCLPDSDPTESGGSRTDPVLPVGNHCASTPSTSVCDDSTGTCVQCLNDGQCTGGELCNPASSACQTPPDTQLNATPPANSNSAFATFQFSSPGNPGATFECMVDAGAYAPCSSPFTTSSLAAGPHSFQVRAVVSGPLKDPSPASHAWTVDTVAPAAPVLSTPANGAATASATPLITGTAEAASTITVYVDGVPAAQVTATGGSFSYTPAALSHGSHVVAVTATDAAGNVSAFSNFNLFNVDLVAPAAPVLSTPANSSYVGDASPVFQGTGEAGCSLTLVVDGTPYGPTPVDGAGNWSFTPPVTLTETAHTAKAFCTDGVGNVGPDSSTSSFTVDLTVLDTTLEFTPQSLSNSTAATFVFSANKPSSTFECSLDLAAFASCVSPVTHTGLAQGAHSFRVRARFGASEVDGSPATFNWTIDTVAPSAPAVTAPGAGATLTNNAPTFAGTAEANSTVRVYLDNADMGTATANALGDWSLPSPLSLAEGAHNVKATARDAAGNTSALSTTVNFVVDTTGPAAPVIASPASGSSTNDNRPTFGGTAEPNATVQLFVDGVLNGTAAVSAGGAWSYTPAGALADGTRSITARAVDGVGNVGALSAPAVTILFDTGVPGAPTLSAPVEGVSLSNLRPAISGTAEPGATVEVTLDGVVQAPTVTANGAGDWSFTPGADLAQGLRSVTARARDAALNWSPASSTRTFTIDTVAPAAPLIAAPADGATVGVNTPTYSGTAEPGSRVDITVDSTLVTTVTADGSGNWSFNSPVALSEGLHSVAATARDAANNASPQSATHVFTVDTTVLDTQILSGPPSPTSSTQATFAFNSNKTPVTYECNLNSGGFGACVNPANFSGLSDGAQSLEVRALFGATPDSTPATYAWTIDLVPPGAPTLSAPAEAARINDNTPTYQGTSEAAASVSLFEEKGAVDDLIGTVTANGSGAFAFTPVSTLSDGLHAVYAIAQDAAGNPGPASVLRTFTVDTVPPAAPVITSPTPGLLTSDNTPTFSGNAEAGATVTLRVDGVLIATLTATGGGAWTHTPSTAIAEGPHSATARAQDAAGNLSSISSAVSFTIDSTPPGAPTLLAPVEGALVATATPTLTGNAEALTAVTVTLDGVPLPPVAANGSGVFSFVLPALADGPHALTAVATDAAGNTGPASALRSFTVDTTAPPAPTLDAPADGAQLGTATPTFSGTAEAGATVTVKVNGSTLGTTTADGSGNWSFTAPSSLPEGANSAVATATDPAGNVGPPSATVSFSIDVTAPAAPVWSAPLNGDTVAPEFVTQGTAEAGAQVAVSVDGALVGTAVADGAGSWSVTVPASMGLGDGPHTLSAQASDAVGNISAAATLAVTVASGTDAGALSDGGTLQGDGGSGEDGGVLLPPDGGGNSSDGGTSPGTDAGALPPSTDAGSFQPDPGLGVRGGGCGGCATSDGSSLLGLMLVAAMRWGTRRKRAGSRG